MSKDLQTKTAGYIPGGVGELLAIAVPMMISSACDTVMTFTSRLFLSKLSTTQMNAALGGGTMSFLMLTFFMGLIGYSTALIGQYYGSGQRRNCPVVVTQSAIIALIAYPLILLVAAPLARSIFRVSGIAPEQLAPQTLYFNILVYAVIIGLMRTVLSCFFSGIGRTRIVMVASVITMLVNVAAEYVLIFGHFGFPAMGIRGAAYGTIVGGICGLSVLVFAYFLRDNQIEYDIRRSFRFDSGVMGKLLKLGYPAGLEFFLAFSAFAAMIMLFQSQGQLVATAATVTFNWDMVAYVPLIGIEVAVTSLVGRYMGARHPDRAHRAAMSGLKIGSVYSAVMLILFAFFPAFLVNVFRPDTNAALFTDALPLTIFMVRFMSVYVLLEAMMVAFCGALRGAGDTFWAMCMSVILHWLMVGIMFVMLKVMHTSAQAAWVAMILWFLGLSSVFVLRYRGGKWRTLDIIHDSAS